MVKFWLYSSASLIACAGLLWYTYTTRQQFYPSVIYLVTSKISVLILGNAALVLTMIFGRLMKSLFLGSLRDAEVEILHENVRYAITETCLALTIFRDEISFPIVVLFTALVFLKIFHWLSQSRIEFIEQTDFVTRLTHMRLVSLMTILAAVDMAFVVICAVKFTELGPSVYILFGFEFLILFISLVAIFMRYVLYVIDARMDGTWTNKFTYLFYLELVSEIFKLVTYLVFFLLILTYYGMPIHIIRDLWLSVKSLQQRIASYFRYRKIAANLNERFPNPTEEELNETDHTCIICREEMTPPVCKKLPCTHIFHIDCLKMWVQRQQTCPTCRSTIPTNGMGVEDEGMQPTPDAPQGGQPADADGRPFPAAQAPFPPPPAHFGVPAPDPHHQGPRPGPPHPPAHHPHPHPNHQHPGPHPGFHPPPHPPAHAFPMPTEPGAGTTTNGETPVSETTSSSQGPRPPRASAAQTHSPVGPGNGYHSMMASSPSFMYGGGMGAPFGFPYAVMPPFGFPYGHAGAPPMGPLHGTHPFYHGHASHVSSPMTDPANIQRQIDALQAQLLALQSISERMGIPSFFPPTGSTPSSSMGSHSPSPVPTQTSVTHQPMNTSAEPSRATADTNSPLASTTVENQDDLEEKRPVPSASAKAGNTQDTEGNDTREVKEEIREEPIPSVMTDAERRREELRRRYTQIYGQKKATASTTSNETDETKKDT